MSPYRYSFIQSLLILSVGSVGALGVLVLPNITTVLILCVAGLISYAVVCYVCYNPNGSHWRRYINKLLIKVILSANSRRLLKRNKSYEQSELVHKEGQKLIQLILRDFVTSWYYGISNNEEFPQEVSRLLEHIAIELQYRIQRANVNDTLLSILPLLDPYITALNEVGSVNERGKITFDVRHQNCLMLFEKKPHLCHPALKSTQTQLEHLQRLADCFICSDSIPSHYKQCDIAVQFIREVLVYGIFHPVLNLLCQPDFLIKAIPLILAKASDEKVTGVMDAIREENKVLDQQLDTTNGLLSLCTQPLPTLPLSPPLLSISSTAANSTLDNSIDFTQSMSSYPYSTYHPNNGERNRSHTTLNPRATSLEAPLSSTDDTSFLEDSVLVNLPPIYINRYVRVQSTNDETYIGYIIKVIYY